MTIQYNFEYVDNVDNMFKCNKCQLIPMIPFVCNHNNISRVYCDICKYVCTACVNNSVADIFLKQQLDKMMVRCLNNDCNITMQRHKFINEHVGSCIVKCKTDDTYVTKQEIAQLRNDINELKNIMKAKASKCETDVIINKTKNNYIQITNGADNHELIDNIIKYMLKNKIWHSNDKIVITHKSEDYIFPMNYHDISFMLKIYHIGEKDNNMVTSTQTQCINTNQIIHYSNFQQNKIFVPSGPKSKFVISKIKFLKKSIGKTYDVVFSFGYCFTVEGKQFLDVTFKIGDKNIYSGEYIIVSSPEQTRYTQTISYTMPLEYHNYIPAQIIVGVNYLYNFKIYGASIIATEKIAII